MPLRCSVFGVPPSTIHSSALPLARLVLHVDPRVRVDPLDLGDRALRVTGALASNSAENAWWARTGALAASAMIPAPRIQLVGHPESPCAREDNPKATAYGPARHRGGNVIDDQRRIDIAQHQLLADDAVFELLRQRRQRRQQRRRHRRHLRRRGEAQMNRRRLHRRVSSSMFASTGPRLSRRTTSSTRRLTTTATGDCEDAAGRARRSGRVEWRRPGHRSRD